MERLRINEAIANSEANGKKIFKKDIASAIFPCVNSRSAMVNFSNMCSGNTKRITIGQVIKICEMCECDPNYLFGWDSRKSV